MVVGAALGTFTSWTGVRAVAAGFLIVNGASTLSVLPINISYSLGIVKRVNAKENYAKHFLDIGAGAIFGFDYCFWPNGASAYSFTIGTSYGVYGGYDYYWCLD